MSFSSQVQNTSRADTSASSMSSGYALDIPAKLLLLQEIQQITSSMRRSPRWASPNSSSSAAYYSAMHRRESSGSGISAHTDKNGPSGISDRALASVDILEGSRGDGPSSGYGARSTSYSRRLEQGEGEEMELLAAFVGLRRKVVTVEDILHVAPLDILLPFLALIRSPLTSGPITSLALTAINSICSNILPLYLPVPLPELSSTLFATPPSPQTPLQLALGATTSALARCRFPSSTPAQDELVLSRLLRVTETIISGNLERELTDEGVCEMLEVGLGMGGRARLGEGLRKTAQNTIQAIVQAGFLRLRFMDPSMLDEREATRLVKTKAVEQETVEQSTESIEIPLTARQDDDTRTSVDGAAISSGPPLLDPRNTAKEQVGELGAQRTPSFVPYGLPTLLELLRVVTSLLDPNDLTHTDSMRLSALGVLNSILEVGGRQIGKWDELVEGIKNEGCRYLFQLIRSDNLQILASALRTLSTLFTTLLPHLKLQFELFLTFLIDRLTPSSPVALPSHLMHIRPSRRGSPRASSTQDSERDRPSTPKLNANLPSVAADTRELMLETLSQLMLNSNFMLDLWINFDCDPESEDVFERMVDFLTKGVYPSGLTVPSANPPESLDNSQLLCFEGVVSFVEAMAIRSSKKEDPWPADLPTKKALQQQKDKKAKLIAGAAVFNEKPKRGVTYLKDNNLIDGYVPDSGQESTLALARFLKDSTRLNKKLLGEYISAPDNLDLLKAFIGLFDFQGKSIADAMRDLLEAFRLPGEAQPIARITEAFAEHFFSFKPTEIADQDATYVLAYSVIMLNTDQHNPQNRKRMTIEDYQKNLRGVNSGKDFAPEYLATIHDSIRRREIIMPQEHVGQAGFDYAWKGLMRRSRNAGLLLSVRTSTFDKAMFEIAWRSTVTAIASAFTTSSQDEYVIQKAITGFKHCAALAGRFQLPEVIDSIVLSLAYATGLLDETDDGYQSANHPLVKTDGSSITVSPLSVRFGTSFRSQLATVVLFTIANGNGNAIREGWIQIFEMYQTLFLHSLLPLQLTQEVDFLSGESTIPLKSMNTPAGREERKTEAGLLSTLSSYLLSPYTTTADVLTVPSEEDIENTLSAIDCVSSCKLEGLYRQAHELDLDATLAALRALRALAEARCTSKAKDYMSSRSGREDLTGRPLTPAYDEAQLPYDPAALFDLEFMVSVAMRLPQHAAETWPIVFEFISSLLSSAQSYSILLIERAVTALLKLCLLICDEPKLRDQLSIALDVLRSLPSSVLNAVSEQLMAGIARILERDSTVVKSQTEWSLLTALFRATVAHPEASKMTLALVQKMASGSVGAGPSADNYPGIVAILDEFATSAGAAASRLQVSRRGTSAPPAATLGPTVERGLAALDTLYEIRNQVPLLISSSTAPQDQAWKTFWLPLLLTVAKHSVNGSRDIRQRAIGYLQRVLLSSQVLPEEGQDAALVAVFSRVLFPVVDELLKPQIYNQDPSSMEETRLRASALVCKAFLQYLAPLSEHPNKLIETFLKIVDLMERFMRTGSRQQYEAVPESLKNVVLVMHSAGMLIPPGEGEPRSAGQADLWDKANERISKFLGPEFMANVVPQPRSIVDDTPTTLEKSFPAEPLQQD